MVKTSEKSPAQDEEKTHKAKKDDYVELKLPKLPSLKHFALSPIWVMLLVILSFLLGLQTARIEQIKKVLGDIQGPTAQVAENLGQNPEEPTLGEKVDIDAGNLPILGKENAKVTMIEFSDFQCPFCQRFFEETFPKLKEEYIDTGKVRFAFRHLPLEQLHPNAPKAAEASECANDQDKFWEYHDALFENFDTWTVATPETLTDELSALAGTLGLDTGTFTTCVTSGKYTDKVAQDLAEGQSKGATGTPTFFINGKILVGALPYETFKTLLDQELKAQ
jgi:protein-disulfide isomerase